MPDARLLQDLSRHDRYGFRGAPAARRLLGDVAVDLLRAAHLARHDGARCRRQLWILHVVIWSAGRRRGPGVRSRAEPDGVAETAPLGRSQWLRRAHDD